MLRKVTVTAFSALALFGLTACVTNSDSATCTVSGAKYISADTTADELCRTFEKRLEQALATEGHSAKAEKLSIAIEISQRGSMEARITAHGDGASAEYPEVGVDVMDRALSLQDLDQLADAVARLLIEE